MRVHIVYAHPSAKSFTHEVLEAFVKGLRDAGHSYTVSDLYALDFKSDLSLSEYERERNHLSDEPVSPDVASEQEKLVGADARVFIYPVWWTDCPAKLKGWFDRVWTVGFAYSPQTVKPAEKALVICTAGHTVAQLRDTGCYQAMETAMLTDHIYDRAEDKQFIVLGGSSELDENEWSQTRVKHLATVYETAKGLAF